MRGLLIAFEGIDRAGKSTQSKMLVESLVSQGVKAELIRFPERSTMFGGYIDQFLKSKVDCEDRMIHLIFVINRWEMKKIIDEKLSQGITLVLDRYSHSGIAYTAAKGIDYKWGMETEQGLPKPDFVFYLRLDDMNKLSQRGGYGEERYEKLDFQKKVKKIYEEFLVEENWVQFNADKSIEEIHQEIVSLFQEKSKQVMPELKHF